MSVIKLLIVVGVLGGGYQYWKGHSQAETAEAIGESTSSEYGFVDLPAVDGANAKTVLVIAAENCPHEDAQRADGLADDLSRNGIPVTRSHNVSFGFSGTDNSVTERIMSVMNGPLPIVIVNGRAKSNPSLDEVLAEYKSARR